MSVTIRLTRIGKKNAPSYRVVATKTRTKRDGKVLEILGSFNPSHNPSKLLLRKDRIEYWQGVGAITSSAVTKLMQNNYQYAKYQPNKKDKSAESGDSVTS